MKKSKSLTTLLAVALFISVGGSAVANEPGKNEPAAAAKPEEAAAAAPAAGAVDPVAEEKQRKAEEAMEAKRKAAREREEARKLREAEWQARCVIRPAMSDEEIAVCREVRTKPAPADWMPEQAATGK